MDEGFFEGIEPCPAGRVGTIRRDRHGGEGTNEDGRTQSVGEETVHEVEAGGQEGVGRRMPRRIALRTGHVLHFWIKKENISTSPLALAGLLAC